ncbi:MAG: pro-sigmaK processing inhibitor BofA family protein [Oscillospiraceae bacterium]|jgi:inhibitor of the pro-sigma K processing machinery
MELFSSIVILVAGVLLMILLIRILSVPLRWLFKVLINAAIGYVALMIFNFFGGFIGLQLAINWVTILVTGFLGLPGVVLLLLAQYLL